MNRVVICHSHPVPQYLKENRVELISHCCPETTADKIASMNVFQLSLLLHQLDNDITYFQGAQEHYAKLGLDSPYAITSAYNIDSALYNVVQAELNKKEEIPKQLSPAIPAEKKLMHKVKALYLQ